MTSSSWSDFHTNAKTLLEWSERYRDTLAANNISQTTVLKAELRAIFGPFFDSARLISKALNQKIMSTCDMFQGEMEAAISYDELDMAHYLLDITRGIKMQELLGFFTGGKVLNHQNTLKEIVRISKALSEREIQD